MAYNQYAFRYTTGRAGNLAALIWTQDRASLRTSGTTLTAIASVADATYASGRLSATELETDDATGTGVYKLSAFPALTPGFYVIEIYDVTTPANSSPGPADTPLPPGVPFYWDGTDIVEGVSAIDVDPNAYEPGGDSVLITVVEEGSLDPIQAALVWLTSDAGGATIVAGFKPTDSDGELERLLTDAASYYMWIRKDGYEPIMGELFTANASLGNTFEMEPSVLPDDDEFDMSYTRLRLEVGRYLGWTANPGTWDAQQTVDMQEIIDSGYRSFLYPDLEKPYVWTFLRPTTTLSLVAGTRTYDLPADFGVLTQDGFTYPNSSGITRIERVRETELRAHYAKEDLSGDPKYAAIHPKTQVTGEPHLKQVSFYPVPDLARTLTYKYAVVPDMLNSVNLYPVGGAIHAETLLQACLAAAERKMNDADGIHNQRFKQLLAVSMRLDQENL